jgi:hypothetical protein
MDPVQEWSKRAQAAPGALDEAIKRKIAKHYGAAAWLVVYLNINDGGIGQQSVEQQIAAVKHRYANSFSKLFVIWKDKLL